MSKKQCADCGLEKDASEFYPRKHADDGLSLCCKVCVDKRRANGRRARAAPLCRQYGARARSEAPMAIPIRPDRSVLIANLPDDLSRVEARRIGRILAALVSDQPAGGESS